MLVRCQVLLLEGLGVVLLAGEKGQRQAVEPSVPGAVACAETCSA